MKQPASALLWSYYYAAQHYDYKQDTDKALYYIDSAIEHTPTLIELYIVKGRIYKVSIFSFILYPEYGRVVRGKLSLTVPYIFFNFRVLNGGTEHRISSFTRARS